MTHIRQGGIVMPHAPTLTTPRFTPTTTTGLQTQIRVAPKTTSSTPTFGNISTTSQTDPISAQDFFTGVSKPFPVATGDDTQDIQSTFKLMNELTAVMGPERYPGIANLFNKGGIGLTQEDVDGYTNALDTYNANIIGGSFGGGSRSSLIAPIPAIPEGLKKLADIKWKSVEFTVEDGNAPSWWVGKVPESADDAGRPDVNYLMTLNSMIPYMSPEDQEAAARALYAADADHFSEYKPQKIGGGKQTITKAQSLLSGDFLANPDKFNVRDDKYFESRGRARGALNMLNQMRKHTVEGNRWKIAPAYTMLQSMLGAMEQYGGGPSRGAQIEKPPETLPGYDPSGGQTPAQLRALMGQLDPLLASANSPEIGGGFAFIAKLLSQPFFSAGQLNSTQAVGKKLLIGSPNPLLRF